MIGFIEGLLVFRRPPLLMLNVNGVGYEVEAPLTVFYDLPDDGGKLGLYTHLLVRADAYNLYGFASSSERDTFRSLLKVNGVGPKAALAILSGLDAVEFEHCVRHGDVARLTRVPGVGRKTAERLIVEMKDRLTGAAGAPPADRAADGGQAVRDAIGALVSLGYKQGEAARAVRGVEQPGASGEELIRAALSRMKP